MRLETMAGSSFKLPDNSTVPFDWNNRLSSTMSSTSTMCLSSCSSRSNSFSGDGNEKHIDKDLTTARFASRKRSLRTGSGNAVEPWIQYTWVLHFVLSATVLTCAIWENGGSRKYVLVDPRKTSFEGGLKDLGQCFKVFVNVLASSRNEPRAVICCGYPQEGSSSHVWSHYDDDSVSFLGICPQLPSSVANSPLPFLGRLTRFPDALIIPLFPLLIRIAVRTYQTSMENAYLNTTTFGVYSFRRFTLYFLLMIFRACVLYVGLNKVLGNFDSTSQTRNDVNGYDDESSNGTATCWYGEWLQETQQSCHGRRFDFSDHIVLFLGQLLPIALVECLHSLDRPYWSFHLYHQRYSLPLLLTAGMVYLYFVTLVGVYKTASYFHTPIECLVGVAISLSSQIPLYLLQCSTRLESVAKLREYFFGRTLS